MKTRSKFRLLSIIWGVIVTLFMLLSVGAIMLISIIEDNGMGRGKSREFNKNNKSQKSKGTFIIAERLSGG